MKQKFPTVKSLTPDDVQQTVRPLSEWPDKGLLWLINSTVFWPRGFSLGLSIPKDDSIEPYLAGYEIMGDGSKTWSVSSKEVETARSAAVEALFEQLREGGVA